MSAPLKNVSVEELEAAIAAALHALSGAAVKVSLTSIDFNEGTNRAGITLAVWDKSSLDPFAHAI